jgi:hypothetical protein
MCNVNTTACLDAHMQQLDMSGVRGGVDKQRYFSAHVRPLYVMAKECSRLAGLKAHSLRLMCCSKLRVFWLCFLFVHEFSFVFNSHEYMSYLFSLHFK